MTSRKPGDSATDQRGDQRDVQREQRCDALLLLALAVACYLEKILLGPYAFVDFYDTIEVHFSHFQNMFTLWQQFGPFSWYPFHAGGAPAFAGQHPPYYPAVFLSGVLPLWLVSLLWNIGQMFLAGYGTLRLLRLVVNPARPVRLFCAALFSLTWISGNMFFVFSYAFPAFLAWTSDLARPDLPRRTRLLAALGVLGVSLFSYPVITLPHFPVLHLALVLFLGRHWPHFWRQVAMVFVVWTGYVLLFTPSIVSLYLYIPYAQRNWDFSYPGLPTALLGLLRHIHGRLTDNPLLPLLLLSLGMPRQRRPHVLLALFAAMLLISGVFSNEMRGLFANTFLVKMDLFLFATALNILCLLISALVLEHYRQSEPPLSFTTVAACAVLMTLFGSSHIVLRNQFLLASVVGLLALLRRHGQTQGSGSRFSISGRLATVLMAVGLACMGMFFRQSHMLAGTYVPYAQGYETHPGLAPLERAAASRHFRVASLDVHPAILQAHGLDTIGGKGPLFDKWYKQLVKEAVRPQLSTPALETDFEAVWHQTYLTRNKGNHDQHPLALTPEKPRSAADFNLGLLRLMGVAYCVSTTPVSGMEQWAAPPTLVPGRDFGQGLLGRVYNLPLYVYPLKDAPGLGRLADEAVVSDSTQELLRRLGSEPANGLLRKVFLLRGEVTPETQAVLDAQARREPELPPVHSRLSLDYWSPDRLVFSGQTAGPALLVVSNNYDPRWTAQVNGAAVPLVRADNAFQGVLLDRAGPFTAELSFHAPLIWQLHLLSALGVALMFWSVPAPARGSLALLPAPPVLPVAEPIACPAARLLIAGLAAAAFWALGFVLFILRRHPEDLVLRYALATIPFIGVAVALWTRAMLKRL
jgi:hypothetical protein